MSGLFICHLQAQLYKLLLEGHILSITPEESQLYIVSLILDEKD